MAVEGALFLQANSHPAEDVRRWLGASVNNLNGFLEQTALAVTQTGTASMQLNVAAGRCWIVGDEGAYQGSYFCENRGTSTVTIAASNATYARIDLVVAWQHDAAYSGTNNYWEITVVTGTASASPVVPTLPPSALALAQIAVAANATAITSANITDLRFSSAYGQTRIVGTGGVIPCTSTTRPTSPSAGQVIYETDTGYTQVYNSSAAWVRLNNGLSIPTVRYAGRAMPTSTTTFTSTLTTLPITLVDGNVTVSSNALVVPFAGNWRFDYRGRIGGTTSSSYVLTINRNGTAIVVLYGSTTSATGGNSTLAGSEELPGLSAGDLITVQISSPATGLTITTGSSYSCFGLSYASGVN